MYLELHNAPDGDGETLCGQLGDIKTMRRAKELVQETCEEEGGNHIEKWILYNESGIVSRWERPQGSSEFPSMIDLGISV